MTEHATKVKKAVAPQPAAEDLSKEIERSVERRADERVRVARVFDDCYRCNWWVQDERPHPFWLPTGTIRKSRFLRAAKTGDGLVVEDITIKRRQAAE